MQRWPLFDGKTFDGWDIKVAGYDLNDNYKQNKIEEPEDQNTLIESKLKGNSKEIYLTFMEEIRGTDSAGNLKDITDDMLDKAMEKMKKR